MRLMSSALSRSASVGRGLRPGFFAARPAAPCAPSCARSRGYRRSRAILFDIPARTCSHPLISNRAPARRTPRAPGARRTLESEYTREYPSRPDRPPDASRAPRARALEPLRSHVVPGPRSRGAPSVRLRAVRVLPALSSRAREQTARGASPRLLTDVLTRVQTHPASKIQELLPHRWKPPDLASIEPRVAPD